MENWLIYGKNPIGSRGPGIIRKEEGMTDTQEGNCPENTGKHAITQNMSQWQGQVQL